MLLVNSEHFSHFQQTFTNLISAIKKDLPVSRSTVMSQNYQTVKTQQFSKVSSLAPGHAPQSSHNSVVPSPQVKKLL
jgi:hypothetical protein